MLSAEMMFTARVHHRRKRKKKEKKKEKKKPRRSGPGILAWQVRPPPVRPAAWISVPAAPLASQLLANVPAKAAEDSQSSWAPEPMRKIQMKLLNPSFGLPQP